MFEFLIKKDEKLNYKNLFIINTLCGENIEFFINQKNNKIIFFSNGSQLNSITANLICEIFNLENNLNKDTFWARFPIKLNGYREESIKNILKEFSKNISLIN